MLGRDVVIVILYTALFAVVLLVTGLAGLFLSESFGRAVSIRDVCSFAAAGLTSTAYIIGGRTDRRGDPQADQQR